MMMVSPPLIILAFPALTAIGGASQKGWALPVKLCGPPLQKFREGAGDNVQD